MNSKNRDFKSCLSAESNRYIYIYIIDQDIRPYNWPFLEKVFFFPIPALKTDLNLIVIGDLFPLLLCE